MITIIVLELCRSAVVLVYTMLESQVRLYRQHNLKHRCKTNELMFRTDWVTKEMFPIMPLHSISLVKSVLLRNVKLKVVWHLYMQCLKTKLNTFLSITNIRRAYFRKSVLEITNTVNVTNEKCFHTGFGALNIKVKFYIVKTEE